jgi:hypothetical protein
MSTTGSATDGVCGFSVNATISSSPRRRFAGGVVDVGSRAVAEPTTVSVDGTLAGDGRLKKNDVMGFSGFCALPLPRFILARPARIHTKRAVDVCLTEPRSRVGSNVNNTHQPSLNERQLVSCNLQACWKSRTHGTSDGRCTAELQAELQKLQM